MLTFEQYLQSLGLDASLLSDARRNALMAAWRAETGQNPPPLPNPNPAPTPTEPTPFNDLVARRRLDQDRRNSITDACSAMMDAHPNQIDAIEAVGVTAMEQGWDRTRTELELIRRFERANLGTVVNRQQQSNDPQLIEIALMKHMGLDVEHKVCRFTEQQLQRADDAYGQRGLTFGQVLLTAARRNGYRGQTYDTSDLSTILRHASFEPLQPQMSGGVPSSYSIPTILQNIANKTAKIYFVSGDESWRLITAISSVRDFKTKTDITLLGGFEFLDLGKNQEIRHASISEQKYTNAATTKAIMLGLSREDLINDDAGVLASRTIRMARGANQTLSRAVWRKLLGAPTTNTGTGFEFHADFKNSGSAALDSAGLKTAMALWGSQVDPDSLPLEERPKYLITGPGQYYEASTLMGSAEVVATGSTDKVTGRKNPYAGLAEVISSPHVANTAMGGASTRWYLMADPNVLPTLETVFLNGVQTPVIETVEMNPNQLGLTMRGYYDFGVALVEKRAAQKNN